MQNCMLPFNGGNIGQGPGINKDGSTITTYSHDGYRAIDVRPSKEKIYAPCDVTCVYHDRINYTSDGVYCESAKLAVFTSIERVKCADGSESIATFLFTHGGEEIQTSKGTLTTDPKVIYRKGDTIYSEGTDGGLVGGVQQYVDTHVHMNVKFGAFSNFSYVGTAKYIALPNDVNIESICYKKNGDLITINSYYTMPNFIGINDDESGEWNGWIADGGYWYYYVEGTKKTGWLEEPANSAKWFYLDPTKAGAMSTGWVKVSGVDYYMNPAEGQSGHDANLAGGQMTRSKWVAGGSKWYYIKESGAMAKSESVLINGKTYNFDSNGVCLNP